MDDSQGKGKDLQAAITRNIFRIRSNIILLNQSAFMIQRCAICQIKY